MARTIGSHGPTTLNAIHEAALQLIFEHGYEAMSLRDLAGRVGIRVGSLYNHIETKQDLLFGLLCSHMEALLAALDEAMAAVEAKGAKARLHAFVRFHVSYHITRKREVFISTSELRSLDTPQYDIIVRMRRRYEDHLIAILQQGVGEGDFSIQDQDIPAAAYNLLGLLTSSLTWFHPGGRMSVEDLIALDTRMVLGAVA
ncbi:MAG: TetR/AcrR family transcriptional regulator [Rhodospirillaceae bacterium]|nr:TetR/AcrR family transcriptional regulator [Rhodospirillaceae bacterium]